MSKKVYLAIPYTWNPEKSLEIANIVAGQLMEEGFVVFSPVSHSHSIAQYLPFSLLTDHNFWMRQDIPLVAWADKVIVVIIGEDGHNLVQNSKGVQKELSIAKALQLPITYYTIKYPL